MADTNQPSKTNTGMRNTTRKRGEDLSNYVFGKVQPQAVPLEEAVLGALMLDKEALSIVLDIIRAESFYVEAHQLIYRAMLRLFERSQPVDLLTVMEELKKSGDLEAVGGPAYLAELTNRVASAANIEYHSRIIAQKHIQRELITVSTQTIRDAFEDTTDVFQLLDDAEQGLFSIAQQNMNRSYDSMGSLASKMLKQLEELRGKKDGLTGVPTGFTALDRITSGWQPSDLIILAARPGMGKTSFVLSLAKNAATDFKKAIAIFSLEMSSLQLASRLISMEAEISGSKLRNGQLEEYEWQQLHSAIERISEAPIFIDDTPGINIFELRAKCRRLKMQHDIQLIIIDYLQLMSGSNENSRGGGNREQEVSAISRALKGLAKELSVPVIALSQLSRAVEVRGGTKRPQLSDLRESGCLTGDTLILDARTGRRVPIRELAAQSSLDGFEALGINAGLKIGRYPMTKAFYSGKKQVFELKMSSGRSIKASANHPFYRIVGWTALEDLQVGDRIASPRKITINAPANPLSKTELTLLAHLIGDGCILPEGIFECDESHIAHFLHHLWATDGNISWKSLKGDRSTAPAIYYGTTSPVLAEQVQHLLLRLGIFSSIRTTRKGAYRPSYNIYVEGKEAQLQFLTQVGCQGERGAEIPNMILALESIESNPNNDVIPKEVWKSIIEKAKDEYGYSWRSFSEQLETAYSGSNLFKNGISRSRMQRIESFLPADTIIDLAHSDIYWDKIQAITPLGIEDVYDATVPGVHNFVANDLIVHNSIEQDADLVSFIYRPEYYQIMEDEEGNSLKGVAEIIIAKHRHGALDTVKLRFTDQFARFSNLDDLNFDDLPGDTFEKPFAPANMNVITRPSRMNDDEDIPF